MKNENLMGILRERVQNQYFKKNNIAKKGNTAMYIKTVFWLLLFGVSYIWYLQGLSGIALAFIPVILAIAIIGNGLNVMHDANHQTLSSNHKTNKIISEIMVSITEIINWLWIYKHNGHHTNTNIHGKDDDIGQTIVRLTPEAEYKPFHKYQHIYAWFLYSLIMFDWVFRADLMKGWQHTKGLKKQEKIRKRTHLIVHKLIHINLYIIIPVFVGGYSWLTAIGIFILMNMLVGLITTIVFQLAHAVPETKMHKQNTKPRSFLHHQLETTANFAQDSKIISWLLGGLNYQIEHHLFQGICHIHYPKIAPIVRDFCEEYDLPYNDLGSFTNAVGSHYCQLETLSRDPKTLANAA